MTTMPLRYVAEVRSSSVDKLSSDDEQPVRLCNYLDVYRNDLVSPTLDMMLATASPDEVSRFRLKIGDSIITKDSEDPLDIGISAYVTATADDFVCAYHLAIIRPNPGVHPRYLNWCLRSREVLGHWSSQASGMTRYGLGLDGIKSAPIRVPELENQRRIADFLDDRVERIDRIVAARRDQWADIDATLIRHSYEAVAGQNEAGGRRASGLEWLREFPEEWAVLTVSSEFTVDLGKMLDEKRQKGTDSVPYLRNTNVQWDRVDTSDLKTMDIGLGERERYTVKSGDLLICEGGQPGRAAIWDGEIEPLGYQKALHRARSRGRSRPAWLLECLRVAVHMNVFAIENGQTTIGHLTNEQLRGQRFPFPEPEVQDRLLAELTSRRERTERASRALRRSIDLLTEYKSSLITAAVTGEVDVTTTGSGIPE